MIVDLNDSDSPEISLNNYGILSSKVNYNLSIDALYKLCCENNLGKLTNKNILAINTRSA